MARSIKKLCLNVFNLMLICAFGGGCADEGVVDGKPEDGLSPYARPYSATVHQFIEEEPSQGPFPQPKLKVDFDYQARYFSQNLIVSDASYQENNDAYAILLPPLSGTRVDHDIWVFISELHRGRFKFVWKIFGNASNVSVLNASRYSNCRFTTTSVYDYPFKVQLKIYYTEPDKENWEYTYSTYVFITRTPLP